MTLNATIDPTQDWDHDLRRLRRSLPLVTVGVVALGVAREVYLWLLGPDTPLQDLRNFSLSEEHCLSAW